MWIYALWKSTLLLSLTLSHEFSKLKPITGIFWEKKAHYLDSPLFILLSFSVTITTEPPPLPQVNFMSDLHDLTFTYCHTVMSGTNEHTMNMSKGWGHQFWKSGGFHRAFQGGPWNQNNFLNNSFSESWHLHWLCKRNGG